MMRRRTIVLLGLIVVMAGPLGGCALVEPWEAGVGPHPPVAWQQVPDPPPASSGYWSPGKIDVGPIRLGPGSFRGFAPGSGPRGASAPWRRRNVGTACRLSPTEIRK